MSFKCPHCPRSFPTKIGRGTHAHYCKKKIINKKKDKKQTPNATINYRNTEINSSRISSKHTKINGTGNVKKKSSKKVSQFHSMTYSKYSSENNTGASKSKTITTTDNNSNPETSKNNIELIKKFTSFINDYKNLQKENIKLIEEIESLKLNEIKYKSENENLSQQNESLKKEILEIRSTLRKAVEQFMDDEDISDDKEDDDMETETVEIQDHEISDFSMDNHDEQTQTYTNELSQPESTSELSSVFSEIFTLTPKSNRNYNQTRYSRAKSININAAKQDIESMIKENNTKCDVVNDNHTLQLLQKSSKNINDGENGAISSSQLTKTYVNQKSITDSRQRSRNRSSSNIANNQITSTKRNRSILYPSNTKFNLNSSISEKRIDLT